MKNKREWYPLLAKMNASFTMEKLKKHEEGWEVTELKAYDEENHRIYRIMPRIETSSGLPFLDFEIIGEAKRATEEEMARLEKGIEQRNMEEARRLE